MSSKFSSCCPRRKRWSGAGEQRRPEPPQGGCLAATGSAGTGAPSDGSSRVPAPAGGAYFSGKARLSFRHRLDSEIESTR